MSHPNDSQAAPCAEGLLEVKDHVVQSMNQSAQQFFPALSPGDAVPDWLKPCLIPGEDTGVFANEGTAYLFHRVTSPQHTLILLRPVPSSTLNDRQLDGFIQQMRGLLQEILLEFQVMSHALDLPSLHRMDSFSKSFCRVYRLLNNLEFLRAMGSTEGVPYHPVPMDLAAFCRRLASHAGDLLALADIHLQTETQIPSAIIQGDEVLLRKLLLTLLSNAALAAPKGKIVLHLSVKDNRVILSLRNHSSDHPLSLDALFPPVTPHRHPPTPQEGAGMGLAIARHIVSLHGGILLVNQPDQEEMQVALSFPLISVGPRLTVCTPKLESEGGLSPFLVELADVLPMCVFQAEEE